MVEMKQQKDNFFFKKKYYESDSYFLKHLNQN